MDTNKTSRRSLIIGTGAAALTALTTDALASPGVTNAVVRPAALTTFTHIDGVPVLYPGDPTDEVREWTCETNFYIVLIAWMRELRGASTMYGGVRYIRSLGFYVNRPGAHGEGKAMDLQGIRWAGGQVSSPGNGDHASSSVQLRRRYLAVDAICRCWFHWALDGWYDADHHDHIHCDTLGWPIRLSKSARSDTVFVQSSCNHFLRNTLIAVDGAWGPLTEAAYQRLRSALGVSGDPTNDVEAYRLFLRRMSRFGFDNQYVA